jgi:tRNA-Thr(GGU) m(6)t(6)A37 methyltransferase TsaA
MNGENMKSITFTPVGIVHSPYFERRGTPIQGKYGREGVVGKIEIFDKYADGLMDIEGFSHLYILYHFHKSESYELHQKPYLDDKPHGIFAIRSPNRPNGIGLSIVRLLSRESNTLHIAELDMLDGTPVLDIKPYIPDFENMGEIRKGWLENVIYKKASDDFSAK